MEYTNMFTIALIGGGILAILLTTNARLRQVTARQHPTNAYDNAYDNAYAYFDCGVPRVTHYYAQRAANCALGAGWCNQPNCDCRTITQPIR